ncbi:hypothetical protein FQA47_004156 [Oryzias melastigma]|uniref:Uncharacterized protein n=1 Tax=Oryzias melastigma TaxID=30732 RepID=A0A834F7G6_ORYME|nr:hypothetical protein FQA47_004156 [Oryzias melastigma]
MGVNVGLGKLQSCSLYSSIKPQLVHKYANDVITLGPKRPGNSGTRRKAIKIWPCGSDDELGGKMKKKDRFGGETQIEQIGSVRVGFAGEPRKLSDLWYKSNDELNLPARLDLYSAQVLGAETLDCLELA